MGYASNNFEYSYDGPVMEFGRIITTRWSSKTLAPSEKKARSNLVYQYKKQFGRTSTAKITLPGKIVQVESRREIS